MKEKDKELLIKDLSVRVFYGIKVNIEKDYPNNPQVVERVAKDGEIIVDGIRAYDIYYYKPYLRPMSSMTEEEREEVEIFISGEWYEQDASKVDKEGYIEILANYDVSGIEPLFCSVYVDWLNAHHFDYRGLIEKGLALEAPKGMYKTE